MILGVLVFEEDLKEVSRDKANTDIVFVLFFIEFQGCHGRNRHKDKASVTKIWRALMKPICPLRT